MAFDAFLKLDGISGESQDKSHKDEIEIFSFSWGLSNSGSFSSGGGGGAGKASFQDLHFESATTKASPLLAKACARGEHIDNATLTLRKAGGGQIEFIKVMLTDVLVSSYDQAGATEGDVPADAFSLNFNKVEFDYFPQKADGSVDAPVVFSFDRAQQK
jgi:type VI secretion system secreted protein Hcp